jgi:type IV fimbrial biogenesis protein FimT
MRSSQEERGITLVEACVVVAVTAITIASATPGLQALVEKQRLDGAAALLATDLQFTRSEAVLRNTGLRLSLHPKPWGTCYVIHTGNADQCDCAESGTAQCTGDAQELKTIQLPLSEHISLQANVSSLLFDPLHGTSTPTGTLKLLTSSGRAVHHIVNVMGRVRTCSPPGPLPPVNGYPVC